MTFYDGVEAHVFVAQGCGHCEEQKAVLASWTPPFPVKVVDCDSLSELADRAGISVTPTTVFLKNKQERVRHEGVLQPFMFEGLAAQAGW